MAEISDLKCKLKDQEDDVNNIINALLRNAANNGGGREEKEILDIALPFTVFVASTHVKQ
jgi:hypothetical protein